MLSRAEVRLLQSLQNKKDRKELGLFIAEGEKIVGELLDHKYPVKRIYATSDWHGHTEHPLTVISEDELKKISTLSTPNKVLALCEQKKTGQHEISKDSWVFAFDELQDPGNLGTIIRIADWFGIRSVVCTTNSVDLYNPKVIQATMGSFIGIDVIYTDLASFLEKEKENGIPVYGTTLQGKSIYEALLKPGIIVFGNESSGISDKIKQSLDAELLIPSAGKPIAESLNVAVSAAAVASLISNLR